MKTLSPMRLWEMVNSARRSYSTTTVGAVFATVVSNFEFDIFVQGVDPQQVEDYLHLTYHLEGGEGDDVGGIIGPFQFSEIAWRDVGFSNWRSEAMDLSISARAAVAFFLLNRTRHNRAFPDVFYSNEIAYLYHNQGPSAAGIFLRTGVLKYPGQSIAAKKLFSQISTK